MAARPNQRQQDGQRRDRDQALALGGSAVRALWCYPGSGNNAVADFAETYADQNERDHAALAAVVTEGRIQAQSGV